LISDVAFKRRLEWPSTGISVRINSTGGDVNIALQVGRILRELNALVVVFVDGECTSSCVFLLAGGTSRLSLGRVGVHRPYFSVLSTKLAPAEVSRAYEEQRALIAKFLNDMHIPSSLLDFMEETEPEKTYYLTPAEVTKYQLNGRDPIFDEMQTARQAEMRGITSAQYRERVAEEDTICGTLDSCYSDAKEQYEQCSSRRLTCIQAVSWGLSIPEYSKRQKDAQRCSSLRESALVACIKKAMLGR
jgi:Clp protease